MPKADFIVAPRWLIPVVPANVILEQHAVVVDSGAIVAILPQSEARNDYPQCEWIDKPDHALTAGLINSHTHAAMTLLRGCADDLPLDTWLTEHIWPLEGRWANQEFVRDGVDLAILEMIAGGTTCFQDMYMFPDEVAAVAAERGMRAVVSMIVLEAPTAWAQNATEYIDKGLAVHDLYRDHPLICTAFGPHAPYTVGDDSFKRILTLANQLEVQVHMHVHETASEVDQAIKENNHRPMERLQALGAINPQLNAVHMTQLLDSEIALLAQSAAHVLHCPESNMKLASGTCPVNQLLAAGVNVCLGTDGAASNNDLDMFGEMQTAALVAKQANLDAQAIPAGVALEMATLNGAKALGMDAVTGSLETGKAADMICVDLSAPATQPVLNALSALVYSASRDQVTDVWIAGKSVYRDKKYLAGDAPDILARAANWGARITAAQNQ